MLGFTSMGVGEMLFKNKRNCQAARLTSTASPTNPASALDLAHARTFGLRIAPRAAEPWRLNRCRPAPVIFVDRGIHSSFF